MAVIVKNTTEDTKQWGGITIDSLDSYALEQVDILRFLSDPNFKTDLASGDALINDGFQDLDPIDAALSMKGYVPNSILGGTDGTIIGNSGDRLKLDVVISNDQLIKVSSNDQTSGYLEGKVVGVSGKTIISTVNDGSDEDLQINVGTDIFDKTVDKAAQVSSVPAGNITSTNVQAALSELDNIKQPLDSTLTSLALYDANGLLVQTDTDTFTSREIEAGDGLNVTNGDGISGNPIISMPNVGTAGVYGSANSVPVITTDDQGRISNTTDTEILITKSQISDFAHASAHLPNGSDPLTTAAPSANLSATTTNSTGTANSFSRSDHSHAISTGVVSSQIPDQSNSQGSSANLARADHIHNIATATASSLSTGTVNTQGTANSFSRSDHTHSIEVINNQVSATSSTTTTSSSDVLMNLMTFTPAAGTYLVLFSTSLESNSTNSDARISIYVGGSQIAHTERWAVPQFSAGGLGGSPSIPMPVFTHAIVTVNGSQAIEGRWRRSSGTITARQRTLSVVKLS